MAAALLYLPANRAFNSNGLGVPGAVAKLYTTGTTTPQNFYSNSALSVSLGSSITANAAGRFAPAYQDETVPFRLRIEDASGAELDDIDPYYFGSLYGSVISTAGTVAATRTDLAALSGVAGAAVTLSEAHRAGPFTFYTAAAYLTAYGVALTAAVTADTAQGLIVAPATDTTGASGAWVRQFTGPKSAGWYGATGDGTTDDAVALQAWLDAGGDLVLPAAEHYSSARLQVRKHVKVSGAGYGFDARIVGNDNMPGSRIRFPAGVGGIIVWSQTTHDDTSDVVADTVTWFTQEGGRYSSFCDLALIGVNSGATATGFESRTRVFLDNVHCISFKGKGFDIQGSADIDDASSDYGNPALSSLDRCRADSNGSHGFHIRGRDASVVGLYDCDAISNGGWGIWDQSLVGGHYANCHVASNTLGSVKAIQIVGCIEFVNIYVEGAARANCDIAANHYIAGGTLSGVTNDASGGGLPAGQNALTTKANILKLISDQVIPGAITADGYVFRHATHGLWLQGHGATYDVTCRNRANLDVFNVPGNTQNIVFAGDVKALTFTVGANQVVGARDTGWAADTGTAKKTATATYTVGSGLTVGAAYVQAEVTAIITRQALIEAAVRDATQEIKALKDALIAHGLVGA
jgi:hypothetical protein